MPRNTTILIVPKNLLDCLPALNNRSVRKNVNVSIQIKPFSTALIKQKILCLKKGWNSPQCVSESVEEESESVSPPSDEPWNHHTCLYSFHDSHHHFNQLWQLAYYLDRLTWFSSVCVLRVHFIMCVKPHCLQNLPARIKNSLSSRTL